jgi:hypothetical protein
MPAWVHAGSTQGCDGFVGVANDPDNPSCVVVLEYARDLTEKDMQGTMYVVDFWRPKVGSDRFMRTICPAFVVSITGAELR